ncbi:Protein-L-isoaspartate carboxylmethyltransferase [Frankia canadensis]|uniref:Protein-L-isoaspartate O-methyltransferase n=1 Tax=Frankia canadensis TaxID=1836972 RepID=A0A2I2L0T8_9ACTN|nr:methyltransferase domain-containing protein [Frankia canadensis]SNQ51541.1 Protein-L-isoaspartate carboxylmethyltransferase [Frankia canadensis]SOU58831.1 Protein-L-isoaspartate carboxylmethyltransferase [Frankia canadensis]
MTGSWRDQARVLADEITHPGSRWHQVVADTPRHELVPAWWARTADGWTPRRGPIADAYAAHRSLVTRVGARHVDQAADGEVAEGRPTSSATMPALALTMYRHGRLGEGLDILDVGTGSGYGTALLSRRFGDERVTTIDVDPYLVAAAAERLAALDLHPTALTVDATGPLPGLYDRIVSMVSVPFIPPSWLAALRPGGRLVTTISGTHMVVTATSTPHGFVGMVEFEPAGFMNTRTGDDYPPTLVESDDLDVRDGEHVGTGRYPVLHIAEAWELSSLFSLAAPGVQHRYRREPDGQHTAIMAHPDGSWARATAVGAEPPTVHQGGPRRLWDMLDEVRDDWLRRGYAPWLGATVRIGDDGSLRLTYGDWTATIPAAPLP